MKQVVERLLELKVMESVYSLLVPNINLTLFLTLNLTLIRLYDTSANQITMVEPWF